MKLTNKNNLPKPLVKAIEGFNKDYKDGRGETDISVTELLNPPLIRQLTKEHYEEIEEDVSDRIWSLLGSAVHQILEKSVDGLVEHRMYKEVDGIKLSGQADYIEDDIIYDYKVTSAWSGLKGIKREWVQQLNLLSYLYGNTKALKIVAIYRDWSESQAKRSKDYPQRSVEVISIPLWTKEEQEAYLTTRLELHNGLETECSPEEKWQRPTVYAIMKEGRKTAVKLYDSLEEAKKDGRGEVVERLGENIRCEKYCSVCKFCPYHKGK